MALETRAGEQIRDAREAAELSQRELARRRGTSPAEIARLESGGVGATLTTLQRAAARYASTSPSNSVPRADAANGRGAFIARTSSFGLVRPRHKAS